LEAIQNVAKHAGREAHVTLRLNYDRGMLAVCIQDDGRGFDTARTEERAGLRNIRERIGTLGGTVELALLLAEEDVESIGAALEPGSSAAVLIWENTWAAPFGAAVRRSGGQLVAEGRIPVQALAAALEADEHTKEGV
jgi:hypothetical protein